jgi:dUTP pyrophosphatase
MKFIKTDDAVRLELQHPELDFTPRRGSRFSAGYDLRACVDSSIFIYPDNTVKIPTGVRVWIGSDDMGEAASAEYGILDLVGLAYPRSSTDGGILNNTVGVIDQDYQGEIFIKLRNITPDTIVIERGQAFVQLVFQLCYHPVLIEVDAFTQATERGEGGFGHTGK